jgi:hypothetical protein
MNVPKLSKVRLRSRRKDQIDGLAGKWSRDDAREFNTAIKPFSEIDPQLWAAEATATNRVRRGRKRLG